MSIPEISETMKIPIGTVKSRLFQARKIVEKQSNIVRYEDGTNTPSGERLVMLADYFDVSLDYIYGRTDEPQGRLYSYEPEIVREKFADQENMREFVEFCFTPGTAGNEKLKVMLTDMLVADQPPAEKKKTKAAAKKSTRSRTKKPAGKVKSKAAEIRA
jgi:transcriptional regulator with XRE-family HTH domain